MAKLRKLKLGDTISVISPGSWLAPEILNLSVSLLEEMGFKVKVSEQSFSKYGHFAGTHAARADALNAAFLDSETKAIVCTRGGYGSLHLLGLLDLDIIKKHPKIMIGYSDVTSLLNYIAENAGFPTFHGPMAADLMREKPADWAKALKKVLSGGVMEVTSYVPAKKFVLKEGKITAAIVGGNLSVLRSVAGTKYMPNTKDKALLIEEIGEPIRKIDEVLQQLTYANTFDQLKGVIIGKTVDMHIDEYPFKGTETSLFNKYFCNGAVTGPVFMDAPFGHMKGNKIIPLGVPITVEVLEERVSIYSETPIFE